MMNLARKEKVEKPHGSRYTIACWLDRAERFAPDDATVKVLHGHYLVQKSQYKEGARKLEEARALAEDNSNVHYNLGLAYFELKEYDKALASAHRAYQLGFPFPGLRNMLEREGKWIDMPAKSPDPEKSQEAEPLTGRGVRD
jgi:tetratricopeptide (TPR) repeat protein